VRQVAKAGEKESNGYIKSSEPPAFTDLAS